MKMGCWSVGIGIVVIAVQFYNLPFAGSAATDKVCQCNPCKHNGICVSMAQGMKENLPYCFHTECCRCVAPWTGPYCDYNTTSCAANQNTCQNDATCHSSTDGPSCWFAGSPTCPPLYGGYRCEIKNPCLSNPCPSGCTCSAANNMCKGYICMGSVTNRDCNGSNESTCC